MRDGAVVAISLVVVREAGGEMGGDEADTSLREGKK